MDKRHPEQPGADPLGAANHLRVNALSTLLAVVLPTLAGQTHAATSPCTDGATVVTGNTCVISAGSTATGNAISGGSQTVFGTASSATIYSAGKQTVSGGSAMSTTVMSGGTQVVISSGGVSAYASGTVINGGVQIVSSGASASGTVVNSGGSMAVAGGSASATVVSAFARQTVTSGVAVNTVLVGAVSSGGTQYISAGGSSINTTVGQKARQTVYAGGQATGTIVQSAGTQSVSSGGSSISAVVQAGGNQMVVGGGTATGTTVMSGGTATLFAGGTTSTGTLAAPAFNSGTVQGTLLITTTSSLAVTDAPVATANALVLNGAKVQFAAPDAAGFKTLTVNGLSGSGQFTMNTQIANGIGDQLIVNNGSGNYTLNLVDSSTTTPHGVTMQLVTGVDNTATFTLANGSIDVGAEKYALEVVDGQYDLFDTGRLGDTAAVAQALPGVSTMLWYQQMEQTSGRLGELRSGAGQGVWIRAYGGRFTLDSGGVPTSADTIGAQFGRDLRFVRPYGYWYAGLTGGVAQAHATIGTSGSATAYPWNAGLYGGLLAKNGWFADASAGYLGSSNTSATVGNNSASYAGNGFSAWLEGGRRIGFAGGWVVEPRVALDYLKANSISYAYSSGTPVQLAAQGTTISTIGTMISKTVEIGRTALKPYVKLDFAHAFKTEQSVTVAGTAITAQTPANWGHVAAGVQGSLGRASHLYLDVGYAKGPGYQSPVTVNVGFSYRR
jgi:outer membrane autotransporter protein